MNSQSNRRWIGKTMLEKHFMNMGLLKCSFRVTVCWRLKKIFKVSTSSFHAGIAGDTLLWSYILPPCLTGVIYRDFLRKIPSRAVARCGFADYDSFVFHAWWRTTTFFLAFREFLNSVSGTMDRTRWTNSKAWSFRWFKSLIFLSLVTSAVYCLYYRSQRRPGLAITSTEWVEMIRTTTWILQRVRQSLFKRATSCVEAQGGHFEHFL
jgi:hypothetical protein